MRTYKILPFIELELFHNKLSEDDMCKLEHLLDHGVRRITIDIDNMMLDEDLIDKYRAEGIVVVGMVNYNKPQYDQLLVMKQIVKYMKLGIKDFDVVLPNVYLYTNEEIYVQDIGKLSALFPSGTYKTAAFNIQSLESKDYIIGVCNTALKAGFNYVKPYETSKDSNMLSVVQLSWLNRAIRDFLNHNGGMRTAGLKLAGKIDSMEDIKAYLCLQDRLKDSMESPRYVRTYYCTSNLSFSDIGGNK